MKKRSKQAAANARQGRKRKLQKNVRGGARAAAARALTLALRKIDDAEEGPSPELLADVQREREER